MTYVLEGREVPPPANGRDVGEAPCIFCGRLIGHINDAAENCIGLMLGAVVDEGSKPYLSYLYCASPRCDKVRENKTDIWRCGCISDYVENVGRSCHACRRPRAKAVPTPL